VESHGERKRVAIACQGGGSHTAFTAGVLKRILRPDVLAGHEIVGLSGSSGGAVCALLAWSALREDDPPRAAALLDAFWADNSATGPVEWLVNAWTQWASALQDVVVTPAISPYDTPFAAAGLETFRRMLERQVDFDALAPPAEDELPMLLIGAVDVLSGEFKAFNSRREPITAEAVLASAAIPTLFRSVHTNGGTYWDGLFSQNPPVRELVDVRPDEIWVIQINPRERADEPRTVMEIADRRNELSGNLSLHQELFFIEKIDQLLEEGLLPAESRYKPIVVRVIELSRSLDTASKLDRDPAFIRGLMAHGEMQAEEFLAALAFEDAWRRHDADAVVAAFADDAELVSSPPFPTHGPSRGTDAIRAFVVEHLTEGVVVDATRKQVVRNRAHWKVRARQGADAPPVLGHAEAEFRDGRVAAFRLTA
jgi:NTE family protein